MEKEEKRTSGRNWSSRLGLHRECRVLTLAGYFGSQPPKEHLRGFCPPWVDGCPGESCFRRFLLIVGERFWFCHQSMSSRDRSRFLVHCFPATTIQARKHGNRKSSVQIHRPLQQH